MNTGKLIFLEQTSVSTSDNGNWACLKDTGECLYCVKLQCGYEGRVKCFKAKNFRIIETKDLTREQLEKFIEINKSYLAEQSTAVKKDWVQSVYTEIQEAIEMVEGVLNTTNPPAPVKKEPVKQRVKKPARDTYRIVRTNSKGELLSFDTFTVPSGVPMEIVAKFL